MSPVASIVQAWRERISASFAANVRIDVASADNREEWLAVIKLTFDRLEAIVAEAERL